MNSFRFKLISLASVSILAVLITPTQARAVDHVALELHAPKQVNLGEEIEAIAVLKEGNGSPIAGATIILSMPANFLSKEDSVEIGRAVTDASGTVKFPHQARAAGSVTLNAYLPNDSRFSPAQASTNLTVVGSTQLYQETAAVRLPGIGVWLLVVILGGIWSTYLAVMLLLTLINREGSKVSTQARSSHE